MNNRTVNQCFQKAAKSKSLTEQWRSQTEKSGMRHTIYALNGDHYKGQWLNNKKHGYGTQTWKKRGAMYEGWWKCGRPHGCGIYSVLDPETNDYSKQYDGSWKEGKKHGHGRHFYTDSDVYEGEWSHGERSGVGQMWHSNGDYYEGEWFNDVTHGHGILRHQNGNWYDGDWKDGKKCGSGRFFYKDTNQLYEGSWLNGSPRHGSISDVEGNEEPTPGKFEFPGDLPDPARHGSQRHTDVTQNSPPISHTDDIQNSEGEAPVDCSEMDEALV
ncbi:MORN repeat-containing protein 3-like [Genypterus blacodes]|uniref:MORN repeat-containing protein 3-like n=1 Tax=Genypterus blacodes TaxID=154954 RepID=UPI003F773249